MNRYYVNRDKIISGNLNNLYIKGFSFFTTLEIQKMHDELGGELRMSSYSYKKFISYMEKNKYLLPIEFDTSLGYRHGWYSKYFEDQSDFIKNIQVATAFLPKGYICLYSAMYFHKLTNQIPKVLYYNKEQKSTIDFKEKKAEITQEVINRALQKEARKGKLFIEDNIFRVHRIAGKDTNNIGVKLENIQGTKSLIASIERTLIDIIVRPELSGGINQVVDAYKEVYQRDQDEHVFSMNKLIQYLKKLDYIYPYHQCIGFLLEKAGFDASLLEKRFDIKYDFYLLKGEVNSSKENLDYSRKWKLYFPKNLKLVF